MPSSSHREDLCLAKTPSDHKLNRSIDILTVKRYLDSPTRAHWKAMKIQADGILARDNSLLMWLADPGCAYSTVRRLRAWPTGSHTRRWATRPCHPRFLPCVQGKCERPLPVQACRVV